MNVQVRAELHELGLTAQAAGADTRALRQILDAVVADRQEGIAGIDTFGDGRDLKRASQRGGKILEAVHGQIDATFGKRLLNFLGEHSLGADLGERHVSNLIARGLDDFKLDLVSLLAEQGRDVMGLPKCKL